MESSRKVADAEKVRERERDNRCPFPPSGKQRCKVRDKVPPTYTPTTEKKKKRIKDRRRNRIG